MLITEEEIATNIRMLLARDMMLVLPLPSSERPIIVDLRLNRLQFLFSRLSTPFQGWQS